MASTTGYYYVVPVYVDPAREGYLGVPDPEVPHLEWWPGGEDLVQSDVAGYLVTRPLKDLLAASDCSGYAVSEIGYETTEKFEENHPETTVPEFYSFEATGDPYDDDFGVGYVYDGDKRNHFERLVVSERGMGVLAEATVDRLHERDRVDERDALRPAVGVDEAARLFFEDPTDRTRSMVTTRVGERVFGDDVDAADRLHRLSKLLVREFGKDELVELLTAYDGETPSAADAVDRLLAVLEDAD